MKKRCRPLYVSFLLILCALLVTSCAAPAQTTVESTTAATTTETGPTAPVTQETLPTGSAAKTVTVEYDFNAGDNGFTADFTDLPVDYDEAAYALNFGAEALPSEIGSGQGLMITGNNQGDELFLFIKKAMTLDDGVWPSKTYQATFEVEFATDATGEAGESVFVKVGASSDEPFADTPLEGNNLVLNMDKGKLGNSGSHGVVMGTISKTGTGSGFSLKTLTNTGTCLGTADPHGNLWILIGLDSGYKGVTAIYFTKIKVTLKISDWQ
jgi:hypothetical protein